MSIHEISLALEDSMADISMQRLLRLADESWVFINETEAHAILMKHGVAFLDHLSAFYDAWPDHDQMQLPTKQVFTTPGLAGDFRVMPSAINSLRLKFVKVIGTNEEQRSIMDKICVGKAMLIDYYDNHVYALFDVCVLSSFRTAAIACLAMRRSGLKPRTVGLIGAGRIGFYTAFILHRWCGLSAASIHDPDPGNRDRFASLCAHYLPGLTIQWQPLDALCRESEAVFLATTSKVPLCDRSNSEGIAFLASVGADADNLSEIDASLLETHRLVTDSQQSMGLGDMNRWGSAGLLHDGMVTELKDFSAATHPKDKNVLFISTGVAVQDALVCKFVYDLSVGIEKCPTIGIQS